MRARYGDPSFGLVAKQYTSNSRASCIPKTLCIKCAMGWFVKSDETYATLIRPGGFGGGYTPRGTQGWVSVAQVTRRALR